MSRFDICPDQLMNQRCSVVRYKNNTLDSIWNITMHIMNPMVFSVMLAAVTASAIAQAGPAVNVTFKNNGTAVAI